MASLVGALAGIDLPAAVQRSRIVRIVDELVVRLLMVGSSASAGAPRGCSRPASPAAGRRNCGFNRLGGAGGGEEVAVEATVAPGHLGRSRGGGQAPEPLEAAGSRPGSTAAGPRRSE